MIEYNAFLILYLDYTQNINLLGLQFIKQDKVHKGYSWLTSAKCGTFETFLNLNSHFWKLQACYEKKKYKHVILQLNVSGFVWLLFSHHKCNVKFKLKKGSKLPHTVEVCLRYLTKHKSKMVQSLENIGNFFSVYMNFVNDYQLLQDVYLSIFSLVCIKLTTFRLFYLSIYVIYLC